MDELCTMSGNVSQMIGLLEMCLTNMGHEIQPGTVLFATIAAVNAVHKVYSSMQVRCDSIVEGNFCGKKFFVALKKI